ncbi:MAG: DNA mismatch repair protein MutL, partial [Thermodesulfobacteriota bacterium]
FQKPSGDTVNPEFLAMEVVGQLWGEFLVAQAAKEFFIIDQHGAAERVRFEKLRKGYRSGSVPSQYLLIPERIETAPDEKAAVEGAMAELERLGFEVAPFGSSTSKGGGTFIIKAAPEMLGGREAGRLVTDLAEELSTLGGSANVERKLDEVFIRVACHSVVRGRRPLTGEEAAALLRDLSEVDFSGHCPHGRPVVKKVTREEVERMFKRG